MWTILWYFGLFFLGVFVERWTGFRFKKESDGYWYLHYNSANGARNKKKIPKLMDLFK